MSAVDVARAPLDLESARARFADLFARIADGAADRERRRELPRRALRDLQEARFGAITVPVSHGGLGLGLADAIDLLGELAEADSNVAHALRGHLEFVEDQRSFAPSPARDDWLRRIADGELIGNAWSERGTAALGTTATRLVEAPDGTLTVHGAKYYTTGTLYADWTDVTVGRDGLPDTAVAVRVDQPGVTVLDDWDGFGQRHTGTGTVVFDGAVVRPEHVFDGIERAPHQTPFFQLVLNAVLTGIARAVVRDAVANVTGRSRVYSHGNADRGRDDPQLQAVVGELSATAFTAEALLRRGAEAVERVAVASRDGARPAGLDDLVARAGADVYRAQTVLSDAVPAAASHLFDALGASGVSVDAALDRHWRNARTVASHNPQVFKRRIVGEWVLNGAPPPTAWAIGVAPGTGGGPRAS
ncbi:acyl-CoA dehydrogenase family protein [Frigoribacterium sp. Leaf172]|uniref:acyl-CoA dehydrogenase family protein n=1 Tax=Frigoribacterium sp. Leaf172 TaxID=1736285 RepID=UPI0006FAA25B|nr:acyl-CoA dehydrogenase family protein [Frigoribacterium sp. Leaf172]KQR64771.1 hypothetical protein ASF89_09980 [Frigoribacterium sp. Leaf172]